MAKINNSAVMQKLIDELELYPASDVIPTELAEKILPTFQVNSQDIDVQLKPTITLWQDTTANDSDKTLTVPDGHTYVVKMGMCKYTSTATVGNRTLRLIISDASGNEIWIAEMVDQPASRTCYHCFSPTAITTATDINTGIYVYRVPFPKDIPLKEGYTIRVYDYTPIDTAADDMELTFMVEDYED